MSVYEEMLAGVATYLKAIPGIATAYYPAPSTINQNPAFIVFGDQMHIDGGQEFKMTGRVRVNLYVTTSEPPLAMAAADAFIEPTIDQFAANNPGYHLETTVPSGFVDRCTVYDIQASQLLTYAGVEYIGAVFWFDYKYRRFAGEGYPI